MATSFDVIRLAVANNTFVFNAVLLVSHDIKERNNGNLKTVKQIICDWDNRNVAWSNLYMKLLIPFAF